MKKILSSITVIAFATAIIVTSCSSPEQKIENAEAKVVEAKQDSAKAVVNAASADEWKMFKNDAEATIKNNEIRIGNLKMKMKQPTSPNDLVYTNRINDLDQQNQNLKHKIDVYDKEHSDWQVFKNEFNHDMEGLGKAFKDLTVTNQK